MADTNVETSSELNQDSLDGAQAPISDAGSAEEIERERDGDTPSASHGDAEGDGNTGDVPDETQGDESREAEGAEEVEGGQQGEEEASNQDSESQQNGQHGENLEADSTETDGLVGEKRKSVGGDDELSPKKARVDGEEPSAEVAAPANGQQEAAV